MENLIPPLGRQIKHWRKIKRMSQLDLSCSSGVTTRHLSFIETGRSRPGKDVVLRLAESLKLPLREQNEMLKLAGLSPAWQQTSLNSESMKDFKQMLTQMLKKHQPYPAIVLDRWWNLIMANETAKGLFPITDKGQDPVNTVELLVKPGPIHEILVNKQEVLWALANRLRKEIDECAGDQRLEELLKLVENNLDPDINFDNLDNPVVNTIFKLGEHRLKTMSTIARFSSAKVVILNELRVEFVYPADEPTRLFFEKQG